MTGPSTLIEPTRRGAALATALLVIAACQKDVPAPETGEATLDCSPVGTQPNCILAQAETVLRGIVPVGDSIAASSELAVAYDSTGDVDRSTALLAQSASLVADLVDAKAKAGALSDLATAAASLVPNPSVASLVEQLEELAAEIPEPDTRWDLLGKIYGARAVHLGLANVESQVLAMPEDSFAQSAYKAVTIRKLVGLAAKQGDFERARKLAALLTMSLDYYRSMANSDIALQALKAGNNAVMDETLAEAEAIARGQDDGYFVAGALREVAQVTFRTGNAEASKRLFDDARAGARAANSSQEKARAMSRIATRMGDIKHTQDVEATIAESITLAESEQDEALRNYSFYEIGGSAAMSGGFEIARGVVSRLPDTPFGTARSLRGAAQRDLAWGLARAGRADEALTVATSIETARERVAALSRIVRVLNDPDMQSLPRYL